MTDKTTIQLETRKMLAAEIKALVGDGDYGFCYDAGWTRAKLKKVVKLLEKAINRRDVVKLG